MGEERRVIIGRKALADLESLWSFVADTTGARTAGALVSRILDATVHLAEQPGIGHTRRELPARYRVWSVHRFLIIYRFDERTLRVARVVHGHRDLRRVLP